MYRIFVFIPFYSGQSKHLQYPVRMYFFLTADFFFLHSMQTEIMKKKETHDKLQNICKIRGVQQTTFELVGYKTKCLHFLYNVNL